MNRRQNKGPVKHVTQLNLRNMRLVVLLDEISGRQNLVKEVRRQLGDLAKIRENILLTTHEDSLKEVPCDYVETLLRDGALVKAVNMAQAIRDATAMAEKVKEDVIVLVCTTGEMDDYSDILQALRDASRKAFPSKLSFVFVGEYSPQSKDFFDRINVTSLANAEAVSFQEASRLNVEQILGLKHLS